MWQGFARLGKWDWIIVGAGVMLVIVLGVLPPLGQTGVESAQRPIAPREAPEDPDEEDATADIVMTQDTRDAYDKWKSEAKFHAAFAVSRKGTAWGWSNEHNSREAAETNALAHCTNRGTGCRVIAAQVPLDGRQGTEQVRREMARFARDARAAAAFAASENGASFWVSGHPSIASAEAAAMKECDARRKKGQAGYLPDWPCHVVMRKAP